MHILEFTVNQQNLTWTNPCRVPVEKTRGWLKARFVTDSEWHGMNLRAIFHHSTTPPVEVPVTSDLVDIPPECILRGYLYVGLVGLDDGGAVQITTKRMARPVVLDPATTTAGLPPESVLPEAWEKALGSIGNLSDLDTTAKNNLVAAINEVFAAAAASGGSVTPEAIAKAIEAYLKEHPIQESDPTVPDWAKRSNPPTYTAQAVGADPAGTASTAVSQHNTNNASHNDIRLLIAAINDRLNAFFDSDDSTLDELSEIVAYIKSNTTLIEAVTTSKVNVADIINNLTTNVVNKPLSAAQGVVLKGLIDDLTKSLSNYQPKGDYALRSELPSVPVKSVNGKTGAVQLTATDVGAATTEELGALSAEKLDKAQGKEYVNLPMVVDDSGTVIPAALSPSGIDGASGIATDPVDLTYEIHLNGYVSENSGGIVNNTTLGLDTGLAKIEPGKSYNVTLWYAPPYANVVCFYSTNPVNGVGGYLGAAVYKNTEFTLVDAEQNVYSFVAPENANYMRYSYYHAKGGFCVETHTNPEFYDLRWLKVKPTNLSDETDAYIRSLINGGAQHTYGHSLNKPFEFSGKTCVAFGDSITFGIMSPNLQYTYSPYIKTLADKLGMTLTNSAVNGTCITDTADAADSIYKKLTTFNGAADVIWIAGGTNDYGTGKPLGEYADTSATTFYGAMRGICSALRTNHADATVIFVTPIPRTDSPADAVESLNAYRNAIFEVATEYGFSVVDGAMLGFPDKTGGFNDFMLADGCHPTQAGHDFYAEKLHSILAQTSSDKANTVELVDTITLTESASSVVRSVCPDGSPYKFKTIFAVILLQQQLSDKWIKFQANYDQIIQTANGYWYNGATYVASFKTFSSAANANTPFHIGVLNTDGVILQILGYGDTNPTNAGAFPASVASMIGYNTNDANIVSVELTSEEPLVANTKILLFGVKS